VHIQDGVEVFLRHLLQRHSANVSGVVDENVNPTVTVQRRINDGLAAFGRSYRVSAGDRLTSGSFDLLHYLLRWARIDSRALQAAAGVIDNNFGATRAEKQSVSAPQAPAPTRNYGYAVVESEFWHGYSC
jgi:hypothetical protein